MPKTKKRKGTKVENPFSKPKGKKGDILGGYSIKEAKSKFGW